MAAAVQRGLPPLERTEKPFDEVLEETIALAKQIAGKTQGYFQDARPLEKLVVIKEIHTKGYGNIEIGVARDGRVIVESVSPSNLRATHLISKSGNDSVVKDITQTCKSVCPDLFPDKKEIDFGNCDFKHAISPAGTVFPAGTHAVFQMITDDPTAPQPNPAQLAAGATISDGDGIRLKPIDEANIQVHQGQGSGSPDCGGGCNSKGCTIM